MSILTKMFGGLTFLFGLLIVIGFPHTMHKTVQPEAMSRGGVVIGLILMGVGLYFLFS